MADNENLVSQVRRQREFIEADTVWLMNRLWYRLIARLTSPFRPGENRTSDAVFEISDYPVSDHQLASDQEFFAIQIVLLTDIGERKNVGRLVVRFLGESSTGNQQDSFLNESTSCAIEPDDCGSFKTTYEIPSGCQAVRVELESTKTRSRVYVKEMFFLDQPPELVELQEASIAVDRRIALYGDLDLNVVDGSAIWLVSIAKVLALTEKVSVDLILKRKPDRDTVIKPLLGDKAIRILYCADQPMTYALLSTSLRRLDKADTSYSFIVVRGYAANRFLVRQPWLEGRLAPYITDLPSESELESVDHRGEIERIITSSKMLLCQTSAIEQFYVRANGAAAGKIFALPPLVPDSASAVPVRDSGECVRMAYAGKFAPQWAIDEMLDVFNSVRSHYPQLELHIFGDKFQGGREFVGRIRDRFRAEEGVFWYGAVSREVVLQRMKGMDLAWAWRQPALEKSTKELSTKILEYGSVGLPTVLFGNKINSAVLGEDYPLFASTVGDVEVLIRRAIGSSEILNAAADRMLVASRPYSYRTTVERLKSLFP